jgi:hypothetical protein
MPEISFEPAWTSHGIKLVGRMKRRASAVISTLIRSPRSAAKLSSIFICRQPENGDIMLSSTGQRTVKVSSRSTKALTCPSISYMRFL